MKKILQLLLFLPGVTFCQSFSTSALVSIPDAGAEVYDSLTVSGLPSSIDSSFGLAGLCFDITHTYDSDLIIRLKSPSGNTIFIASQVGGNGHNFTGTCIAENGAGGYIVNWYAPFTGIFIPFESLNNFNNGQNPNGTWLLAIQDVAAFDTGNVYNFSLTFSSSPPPDPAAPPILCTFCSCPGGTPDCDLLPDMTASALEIQNSMTESAGSILFGNATPNIGWGPLEIRGVDTCFCDTVPVSCATISCPNGDPVKQLVYQRIYVRTNNNDTLSFYDRPAGTMSYHPTHGHIHVDHWADFTIRSSTSNPDATTWPILGTGTKQSFCLINLGDCNSNYGYCVDTNGTILTQANIPNSGFGFVSGCSLEQGIYPGLLDIYSAGLNDPINLAGICNGDYYIVSITDPENNMLETNENNNWVAVPVHLSQQAPAPSAAFSLTQAQTQIAAFGTGIQAGMTFVWDFGDGITDSQNNPTLHTYSANGTYTVTLTVTNSCGSVTHTQTVTINTVGTSEPGVMDAYYLTASPVPVTSSAAVKYYIRNAGLVKINLINSVGQEVAQLVNNIQADGYHELRYDFKEAGLAKGIYFVKMITGEKSLTIKISYLN